MKISQLVEFRNDLLFTGAVQVSWLEEDHAKAKEAVTHFVFHGPSYHGFDPQEIAEKRIADTATLTREVLAGLNGKEDSFLMAIAGYGSGKSHYALTLSYLLSKPNSHEAKTILENLKRADSEIAIECINYLEYTNRPYLVVALNGMRDFDLSNEIARQVIRSVEAEGLNTEPLETLRPRFKHAETFVRSFFEALQKDFEEHLGQGISAEEIIQKLRSQDEDVFKKISSLYEKKMGVPIKAIGQESLHDLIRVTCESYCGQGKHFAGLLIIFDEFGRYLEFAVTKSHIAGPGAVQQLFEAIQTNAENAFLLCFIQHELKTYISRVAIERQDELTRYVTRYDSVKKYRLTTNLETLIANLIEKKAPDEIASQINMNRDLYEQVYDRMQKILPELSNHRLWTNRTSFKQVIQQGCWPLHPLSVWMYFRLASIGRSLQQRSALSLLGESFDTLQYRDFPDGKLLYPTELCSQTLIEEFKASELFGLQGAVAYAFESVLDKYQYELFAEQIEVLKSILIFSKIGIKVSDEAEYAEAISYCSGLDTPRVKEALNSLALEFGIVEWNGRLHQYEIIADAVPRRTFLQIVETEKAKIGSSQRAAIFGTNIDKWCEKSKDYENCDFGSHNDISTIDFNYQVFFTRVDLIKPQIYQAFNNWIESRHVTDRKGQLVFCYVGPESDLASVKEMVRNAIGEKLEEHNEFGAPIVVVLLPDNEGKLGDLVAECFVLEQMLNNEEYSRFLTLIKDRLNSAKEELSMQFDELVKNREIITASPKYEPTREFLRKQLTQLFGAVYPEIIPFPVDGFNTARGNAAEDTQEFTRQLLLGTLDQMWIANRPPRQQNRAHNLFHESWKIFNNQGQLRNYPANAKVKNLIVLIESLLNDATGENVLGVNCGQVIKMLCMPPYGLNIASAGLILALFIALNKDSIDLVYQGKPIDIQTWQQNAFAGRFLSMPVLEKTYIVKVAEEQRSEWKCLLEEWEVELTNKGKVEYLRRAEELMKRIPLPSAEHWHYEHLASDARRAIGELRSFDEFMNRVLDKAERALEQNNMGKLVVHTGNLMNKMLAMKLEEHKWTPEQIAEIEKYVAKYRIVIETNFSKWLSTYYVRRVEDLAEFKRIMSKIIWGLEVINASELRAEAERHLADIEEKIREIEKLRGVLTDINSLISNPVSPETTRATLKEYKKASRELMERVRDAINRGVYDLKELDDKVKKLLEFINKCDHLLQQSKERARQLFNVLEFSSLLELESMLSEVNALIKIFAGEEKDVEDLQLVQKQLGMLHEHWGRLDNLGLDKLDNAEYVRVWKKMKLDMEELFGDDGTPLDNDLLYNSMFMAVLRKRREMAEQWMQANTKIKKEIKTLSAEECTYALRRLQQMPPMLSVKQRKEVYELLQQYQERLDELEVEGLVAMFKRLSPQNQKAFLEKIKEVI